MPYELIILPAAEKELRKLPKDIFLKVDSVILALRETPRPANCKKLQGFTDLIVSEQAITEYFIA